MRKRLLKGLWAASLVAVLAVISMPVGAAEIHFKVPFSFTVNGAVLPPGTYTISNAQSALWVRGFSNSAVVMTNRLESLNDTGAKLVFDKYGDQYTLRQAWTGGGNGRELPRPRLARELADAARSGEVAKMERVVIPAL
ncbi:MAG TPA: hypothetical protein VN375_17630 [Vicinamibacteria bacterium]|nr:hypothetical protein [Vicinamibacteria bacterium]